MDKELQISEGNIMNLNVSDVDKSLIDFKNMKEGDVYFEVRKLTRYSEPTARNCGNFMWVVTSPVEYHEKAAAYTWTATSSTILHGEDIKFIVYDDEVPKLFNHPQLAVFWRHGGYFNIVGEENRGIDFATSSSLKKWDAHNHNVLYEVKKGLGYYIPQLMERDKKKTDRALQASLIMASMLPLPSGYTRVGNF